MVAISDGEPADSLHKSAIVLTNKAQTLTEMRNVLRMTVIPFPSLHRSTLQLKAIRNLKTIVGLFQNYFSVSKTLVFVLVQYNFGFPTLVASKWRSHVSTNIARIGGACSSFSKVMDFVVAGSESFTDGGMLGRRKALAAVRSVEDCRWSHVSNSTSRRGWSIALVVDRNRRGKVHDRG
jgi:hypothetical protein